MALIVKKFGGTSLSNKIKLENAASIIINEYNKGNQVIAVVSAPGHTTDELINKYKEISDNPSLRETDALLSVGEMISMSLLAMLLISSGYRAISLTGWQAGINTDNTYMNASIQSIALGRIQKELNENKIIIIAGFQGVNEYGDITTLGRGGSDTSAVTLASYLGADKCQIYTDVNGVYTGDPNKIKSAQLIPEIDYKQMLALSQAGAGVLHSPCIKVAMEHNIIIEVLSSLNNTTGTKVMNTDNVCISIASTAQGDISKISIIGPIADIKDKILECITSFNINVQIDDYSDTNFSLLVSSNNELHVLTSLHDLLMK